MSAYFWSFFAKSPPETPPMVVSDSADPKCFLPNCRLRLKVGGKVFQVCREQLAHASGFFRDSLFGEGVGGDIKELEIIDESPEQILLFLEALKPHSHQVFLTAANLPILLRLSDKYGAGDLKQSCGKFLIHHLRSLQKQTDFLELLEAAVKYDSAPEIISACKTYCVRQCSLQTIEKYGPNLNPTILSEIYAEKLKIAGKEIEEAQKSIRQITACAGCGVRSSFNVVCGSCGKCYCNYCFERRKRHNNCRQQRRSSFCSSNSAETPSKNCVIC